MGKFLLVPIAIILAYLGWVMKLRCTSKIINGILANVYFLAMLFILLMLIAVVSYFCTKSKLYKFFGISKDNPSIILYLPGIKIKKPWKDYVAGSGALQSWEVIYEEMRELVPFVSTLLERMLSVFGDVPLFPIRMPQVKYRQGKIDPKNPNSKIEKKIRRELEKVTNSSIISIGGPRANSATKIITDKYNGLKIETAGGVGKLIDDSSIIYESKRGEDFAVLERFVDKERNNKFFVVAGRGRNGVYQAANHLMREWKKLHREHKDEDFKIPWKTKADSSDRLTYRKPNSTDFIPLKDK